MKTKKADAMIVRSVLALVALVFPIDGMAMPPKDWEFQEWDAAVVQANVEKKPLFVLFGFEDCQWCEYLYRRGMNDSDLRTKYKQNVVLAYMDTKSHRPDETFALQNGSKIRHADLIKRFQAHPTPSWIFFSPAGEVLHTNRNGKSTSRELRRDIEIALSRL